MKITAAVIREKGDVFTLEEMDLAAPRADEVLVRMVGVGICHTDLVCRDQYYPVPLPCVFGHEGSGVVEQVGDAVTKLKPGDHVVLSFDTCGTCPNCNTAQGAYCHNLYESNFLGTRPDGTSALSQNGDTIHGHFFNQSSFATHAITSESNTVKVDNNAPLEILGPLGCGIQTGAGAVMNALQPPAGSSIAIFGAGSVGLSAVLAAVAVGCSTIIVVDVIEERLAKAKQLGATHSVHAQQTDPVEQIQQITGFGANYSLECTGLPAVTRQAVDCLTLTGVCGQIGVAPLGTEVTLDLNNIMFGRTLRGIIEGDSIPDQFIPTLVALHQQGKFPFDKLIDKYPFSEINKAVSDTEEGKVVKAVLSF